MSAKRKRTTRTQDTQDRTEQADIVEQEIPVLSNTTPKSLRVRNGVSSPTPLSVKRVAEELTTPTAKRTLPIHSSKQSLSTPKRSDTPRRNAADRSAKRKSSRRILEKAITAEESDDEGRADADIAEQIVAADDDGELQSSDGDEGPHAEDDNRGEPDNNVVPVGNQVLGDTLVKRGRGRPKGSKNREITPPKELPAHEWYFWINRPNGSKTSANTFPPSALLSHGEYHEAIHRYKDHHVGSIQNLHHHHSGQFPLWDFELKMGFNVLLYGYGDKMPLLKSWADWLYAQHENDVSPASDAADKKSKIPKKMRRSTYENSTDLSGAPPLAPIVIVLDAHHPALTPHNLFSTIANASLPSQIASTLPKQPSDACAHVLSGLTSTDDPTSPHVYILLNPIHAPLLTHSPMPSLLSRLASHPRVHLLAAADDPHAPLLWPQALKDAYNWVFHDGTTFVPFDSGGTGSVAGAGVVDTVNELLGRKGARGKGREGVRWVLRSLPENARGVYRILVADILSTGADDDNDIALFGGVSGSVGLADFGEMDLDIDFGMADPFPEDDDEDMLMGVEGGASAGGARKDGRKRKEATIDSRRRKDELPSIPYRTLYAKAVEEFLCSSEMAFRGLLKEFVDHQMVVIKRDMAGQEALTIDMRRDELEGVLEDLMMAD